MLLLIKYCRRSTNFSSSTSRLLSASMGDSSNDSLIDHGPKTSEQLQHSASILQTKDHREVLLFTCPLAILSPLGPYARPGGKPGNCEG